MKIVYTLPALLVWMSVLCSPTLGANTQWPLESDEDVCSLFPNGAMLRKPGTCGESIICQDGKSTPGDLICVGTQGIKLDTKKCGAVSDAYCKDTCAKTSPTWVSGVRNCRDWTQCKDGKVVSSGTCPTGQVFDQTLQRCHYPTADYTCGMAFDICNIAPKEQPFWDADNCHKFFVCNSKQSQEVMECPTGHYYDKRSGLCNAKAQVDCYKHPYPENVCGTAKLAIRDRFVRDQATCSGYFYCTDYGSGVPDTKPTWGQCTKSYFFDEHVQACRPRTEVACDEDRCVGRPSGFELAPIAGCQHYLKCVNGYTDGDPIKCEEDKYFDASTEQCVDKKMSYPICA
ncbi:peritrophin-48-like [Musca vetustissima]|uniref:peritrophin-48-like n=1 Tax=Musca vetustissima TaxID=27455 RepID=UPI002AB6F9F8|nr:peritrophin-48-like [Musca vetustissima]